MDKKEYSRLWRLTNKDKIKQYDEKNKTKRKKYLKKYYQKNKKKYEANHKRWEENNKEKFLKWKREYQKKYMIKRYAGNKSYFIENANKQRKKYCKSLHDIYIKHLLNNPRNPWKGVPIPKELIEQKRMSLMIKRKIKEINHGKAL